MKPLLVLATLLLASLPGWAVLGQPVASVQSDQARMKGTLRVLTLQGYSVRQIGASDGSIIREYVSPAGLVFGVAWQGPRIPDLRDLLGAYFAAFQQAAQAPRRRGPLHIESGQLVVDIGGHMRSFHGRAYVTGLVPSSVSATAIR